MAPRLLLLFLFLTTFSSLGAEQDPYKQFINKLIEVQSWMKDSVSAVTPIAPCISCTTSEEQTCDYNGFCNQLESNRNSSMIYQSEEGTGIPNFGLIFFVNNYMNCHATISQTQHQIRQNEINQKQNTFFTLIKTNLEEETFNKIEMAAIDLALTNTDRDIPLDKLITLIENHAGVTWSPESRSAYMEYISSLRLPAKLDRAWRSSVELLNEKPLLYLSPISHLGMTTSAAKLAENQNRYQIAANRSENILKSAQESLISILKRKRNTQNQKAIDEMIHRIETVSLNFQELPYGVEGNFCPGPNAFYNPNTHSMNLCPQILELPEISLKTVIAHELGHAIDPCIITGDLKEYNIPINQNQMIANNNFKQGQQAQGIHFFTPATASIRTLPNLLVADVFESMNDNYITMALGGNKKSTSTGIPISENPFSELINCLHSENSIKAEKPDPDSISAEVNSFISTLEQQGYTAQTHPTLAQAYTTRQRLSTLFSQKGACSFIPGAGNSQIQEAFADWIAAEVVAQDISLENDSKKKKTRAFESMSLLLAMGCPSISPQLPPMAQEMLNECNNLNNSSFISDNNILAMITNKNQDPHPWEIDRINRIMMANPEICAALGCDNTSNKAVHCE